VCVLLVQPKHDDREMYAAYLRHEGLAPICIATAIHALRIAPRADVIVTALLLPGGVNGFELIATLKRDVRTKNTPIVVLTACAWTSDRERATAAGCDVFLSKPCLPHELVREIRRLVPFRRRRPRRRAARATAGQRAAATALRGL
jgi:two-component system cell cycle response regulator DivK